MYFMPGPIEADLERHYRKVKQSLPTPSHQASSRASPTRISQSPRPEQFDGQSPHQADQDLLYLNILNDAVKDNASSSRNRSIPNTPYRARPEENVTRRNCLWTKPPSLDDADYDYLLKKTTFDLPSEPYIDSLVNAFFEHVHPFTPAISRADFMRSYRSGDCSLFLIRAMLTPAVLHVPEETLSALGFSSRAAAQESLFSKAKLLFDFELEDDPLMLLQGCLVLSMVILDHPTDQDHAYWFYNAVRLATKLDLTTILSDKSLRSSTPQKVLKLYRRTWWALFSLDVFQVFINPRRSRLLQDIPNIKPRAEDDWEDDHISDTPSSFLHPVTTQQRALPVLLCELSRIVGRSLQMVKNKPDHGPRQVLLPLDTLRQTLLTKLHLEAHAGDNIYYTYIRALSYRYECILCRLLKRQSGEQEWVSQRLRSAILELDTIAMRVLASQTLPGFPAAFITTMTALLALHIEAALDPAETELVHSMSRISINQTMLLLTQNKEIPVLKRALPVFEEILSKKSLYLTPPDNRRTQDDSMREDNAMPTREGNDNSTMFNLEFLGFDFLDEWQMGQADFDVE